MPFANGSASASPKLLSVCDQQNIQFSIQGGPKIGIILYDDDDEIAYFTVRWKTRELVLSIAPKTSDNTDKDSKNRKRSH